METSRVVRAAAAAVVVVAGIGNAAESAKGTPMNGEARGSFEVKMTPASEERFPDGTSLGRYTLAKEIHGDLEATSRGEMLGGGTPVEGSAGYVAMERVKGSLHGRRGSFLLQHVGKMSKAGGYEMNIAVVPDSGTGELVGLAGRFEILLAGGRHDYRFEYSIAPAAGVSPVR
jgi:hypothetical protein